MPAALLFSTFISLNNYGINDHIWRILGECLLISSLPGKALRMLVESRGLPSDSTSVLKALPGKLHIERLNPGILFISLSIGSLSKLVIMT